MLKSAHKRVNFMRDVFCSIWQLAEHQVPVLAPGTPVFRNALGGKIEHPVQRIIVGKAGLVFRDLPVSAPVIKCKKRRGKKQKCGGKSANKKTRVN